MFINTARGFLFIGDPHVCSKRVGRRKDDYLASVIGKLAECAQLCLDLKLVPVILGDLFHRNDDNNLSMLNALIRVLQRFPCVPLVLEGNHDKEQTGLSAADSLDLLSVTGTVEVISAGQGAREYMMQDRAVRLLGCPYGSEVPDKLSDFDGITILLTHHDLAFGSSYPGSLPLKGIMNCDMVVNGHMHDTKPSVKVADTWWHNPGNIEPLSVDLAAHVPCGWEWTPAQPVISLLGHTLAHGKDLFDLTGLQVQATDSLAAVQELKPASSEFADLLSAQGALDASRTDDATILLEDLNEVLEAAGISEASKQLMQALAAELVIEATSA